MLLRSVLICFGVVMLTSTAQAENRATVAYLNADNSVERAVESRIQAEGNVADLVSFINEQFTLPESLTFQFGAEDGPLYDPQINTIMVPYAFVEEIDARFKGADYAEQTGVTIADATADALLHTLFHEFAHAAIAMYQLPVLGKEEDAADALASVLLIEYYDQGQEIARSAADLFILESEDREVLDEEDFWDEHSLDEQRYFSTLCHIYGSNPQGYTDIIEDELLSEDRAERCIDEYAQIVDGWGQLLEPYMKEAL